MNNGNFEQVYKFPYLKVYIVRILVYNFYKTLLH